jgi:hypothetical protein
MEKYQSFIQNNILIRELKRKSEVEKYGKDICPNCQGKASQFFRNICNTIECPCGRKFYGE